MTARLTVFIHRRLATRSSSPSVLSELPNPLQPQTPLPTQPPTQPSVGGSVRLADICSEFGDGEHVVDLALAVLRSCAQPSVAASVDGRRLSRDQQVWTPKPDWVRPSENQLQALCPPELWCRYESMLAAQQRCLDVGVVRCLLSWLW